jgi:hypothetical protein
MMPAYAELPTPDAVEAFAAQTAALPSLDQLFADIEKRGFSVGIEGRLRAMALIARLSTLGVAIGEPDKLHAYLLPILAQSQHERAEIGQIMADWLEHETQRGGTTEAGRAKAEEAIPKQVLQSERADRTGWVTAAGLVAFAVVVLLAILLVKMISGGASFGDAASEITTYRSPVVGLPTLLDPYWQGIVEDVLSRLLFALPVLLVGFSLASWRAASGEGRLSRRFGETNLVDVFRLPVELPKWFRLGDARLAFDRLKRSRWFATNRIDVAETIAETVHAGGRPVIAWERQQERPNYVLIVDRAARDDHAGVLAHALEAAIRGAEVFYTRYDFSGSLNRLSQVHGGARDAPVDGEALPFSVVASRHAGERLILLGSGERFFEKPGTRQDRSGQRRVVRPGTALPELLHTREFGAVFLLTPTPRPAWGERERLLQDIGFIVLTADLGGVADIAARIARDPDDAGASELSEAQRREEALLARLQRDALRLTSDIPPRKKEEIARLVTSSNGPAIPRFIHCWRRSRPFPRSSRASPSRWLGSCCPRAARSTAACMAGCCACPGSARGACRTGCASRSSTGSASDSASWCARSRCSCSPGSSRRRAKRRRSRSTSWWRRSRWRASCRTTDSRRSRRAFVRRHCHLTSASSSPCSGARG